MKHYFLGMAANYRSEEWSKHTFTAGSTQDYRDLEKCLFEKYKGETMLCKNGRSALTLALKAYFDPGDMVLVNGFTCYAVYEAVITAGLIPVFVDISKDDLNFDLDALERSIIENNADEQKFTIKGIIVQNTLGNPVDIKAIERFTKKHNLIIIEDLAHCAGIRYKDGREVGTIGTATVLSFGKEKSIDTISGGAVVFRKPKKYNIKAPNKAPKPSDHLRARFYPTFGALCRGLSYIRLGGALMRVLVKIHWVERSADNKLDLKRLPSKFEAKLALEQIKHFRRNGEPQLRDFCFVKDRDTVLDELQKAGYFFAGLWYEKPVSPERYYKKVHFPEKKCPNAVWVAEHILNLPNYYTGRDLAPARRIIKKYITEGKNGEN